MKETRFISQNKEKWHESENLLGNAIKDPEKLSTLFTQVVDDLSYSRTYYPNRSVRVYLNKIARQYFSIIYSHQKEHRNRFKLFWLDELPQIILVSRKQLIISLLVFLVAMAIGIFSSYKDLNFTSTILGEDYVAMTKENIEKGDAMAVYKSRHQVDMFLGITLNNLRVAFMTYVFGIFLAIGSLAIVLYNGIMVGCFQFFFIERGLFVESALTIWLHGTLEISSIILAGGAGLTLGSGLIFPGTYSRLQAFQLSAIRSLKLMLGIAPVFVLAAIIESFLSRYSNMPDYLKLVIILLSAAYIIGYFVIYPWLKSKSGFEVPLKDIQLPASISDKINYTRIKNNADIVKDTFVLYSKSFNKLTRWILGVSLASAIASYLFSLANPEIIYIGEWWENIFIQMVFVMNMPSPWFIGINGLCMAVVMYRTMNLVDRDAKKERSRFDILAFFQLLILASAIFALIYLGGWGIFFLIIGFPLLLMACYTQFTESSSFFYGIAKAWDLIRAHVKQTIEFQFIIFLLLFSFLMVASAPLLYWHTEVIQWNFSEEDLWARQAIDFLHTFIKVASFYFVVPILTISVAHLYYTQEEILTATSLKESISKLGLRTTKSAKR